MRIHFLTIFLFVLTCVTTQAQDGPSAGDRCLMAIGRPSADSIMIRWAPVSYGAWQNGNTFGYTVERYTLVRDGQVITPPVKKEITRAPLKPWPVEAWEGLVNKDRYGAIAAQALYGGTFELDMGQSDVFQIVNKAKETEQRFHFALFSADMSPAVARASALLLTDRDVTHGEKYLYRILIYTAQDTCRGSLFMGPGDVYDLPAIEGLKAEKQDAAVMLQWEKDKMNFYSAYLVERSEDGRQFAPVSEDAVTNLSPDGGESKYIYFSDSLTAPASKLYYRVKGITPFGEQGPSLKPVEATAMEPVVEPPHITSGYSANNETITLQWELPEAMKKKVSGFNVERAGSPQETFRVINPQVLPGTTFQFTDPSPGQVNYYQVAALSETGRSFRSPLYLVQLVDSIPPVVPEGLAARIDEQGRVVLTWNPNPDEDIYGYRIYRANFKSEELSQITHEPIPAALYTDTVNLKTLNKKVYYRVMAIDRNQNHSGLSELLEVELPDQVRPVSPVFLPVHSSEAGVALRWMASSSDDVVRYELYRQKKGEKQWMRLKTLEAGHDTLHYHDTNLAARQLYHYTVVAIDGAGLESDPAQPVAGNKIDNGLRPPVEFKEPVVDRESKQVTLSWIYTQPGVQSFRIFKITGEGQATLYRTVQAGTHQFNDVALTPGVQYGYRIMALFDDQAKSELSDVLKVSF